MNMRKTITFADVMNYPEQSAPSSQENDTTSEDNSSDSDEFAAFASTTLVESKSTNLINRRHEQQARRRLPTTESSTAKVGKSKIPVKASQPLKSTPNDCRVIQKHPTTSSQTTSRSILAPKNESKTSRTKADQMQKYASLSMRSAKLSPPAADKKEERGLLRAPVTKQSTTDSQPTLRQRAVVKNESNLERKKADQKCTSLLTIKAKLPPALAAKNEEIVRLTDELAAVKSELAKTKHELHIHEKKECELWGALNDERQTFNDLANETRNLESALENMMVENTRQSQLIDQLHVRIHESDKKHKELVLTQEEAHRKWNERQLSTEDQFSRADEQLKLTEKELHDALMASHQLDVQVNSLQKILHRLVEEHDVSTVYPLVWHPDIITSTQENKRSQLLALQSNSEMQKNHNDAVDALKADNEQLKTKNEALSKILEEFEAMCDALHAQVQSHDSTMEETQKIQNDAVDALKADIERLEAKNEALSGMLQDFQSKYDEHQAQEQSHDSTMEEVRRDDAMTWIDSPV
ncbi:unnamed protein product [Aphanomyces euteiches]